MKRIEIIKNNMEEMINYLAKMELDYINSGFDRIVDYEFYVNKEGDWGIEPTVDIKGEADYKFFTTYENEDVIFEFNLYPRCEKVELDELKASWRYEIEDKLKERLKEIEGYINQQR
ncbi:hypothetical protein [Clostridium sp.]|uniref:hypothetical protein n=1 Tax=Clostridium sp. TaxID=1506 RepID=UPI0039958955